jgi:ferredoxin--NADP+ reductase
VSQFDENVSVLKVTHWTKTLFSFELQRPQSFRFLSGEFVLLGLSDQNGKQILRAYSIASPTYAETLLFYSINIEGGPLTSMLSKIQPNDKVILKRKPTGTLILDALRPGKRLFLFSTGTGIAPFASLVRDPETYKKFSKVILTHTCRNKADLAFGEMILAQRKEDLLLGQEELSALTYYPTLTREKALNQGRITDLIISNKFFLDLEIDGFSACNDRVMLCGSQSFNKQLKSMLMDTGFEEGSINVPSDFVLEKAFVG